MSFCVHAQVQLVPFPTAAGVPYSVVVYAVTGGGRGAVSERVTFFSRELGQLRLPGHTICFIHLLCKGNNIHKHKLYTFVYYTSALYNTYYDMLTAPTKPVSGLTAILEDDTSMTVSWTELTLREAQGFPVYTVLYEPNTGSLGRVSRQAASVSGVAQPPVTAGGLDPTLEYTVRVRVDTGETTASGSGLVSESGESVRNAHW